MHRKLECVVHRSGSGKTHHFQSDIWKCVAVAFRYISIDRSIDGPHASFNDTNICLSLAEQFKALEPRKPSIDRRFRSTTIGRFRRSWTLWHSWFRKTIPARKVEKTKKIPTDPFTIFERQNVVYDVPEQHKIRGSSDREALKLRNRQVGEGQTSEIRANNFDRKIPKMVWNAKSYRGSQIQVPKVVKRSVG